MAWWSCALGTRSGQHLVLGPGLGGSSQVRARRGIGGRPGATRRARPSTLRGHVAEDGYLFVSTPEGQRVVLALRLGSTYDGARCGVAALTRLPRALPLACTRLGVRGATVQLFGYRPKHLTLRAVPRVSFVPSLETCPAALARRSRMLPLACTRLGVRGAVRLGVLGLRAVLADEWCLGLECCLAPCLAQRTGAPDPLHVWARATVLVPLLCGSCVSYPVVWYPCLDPTFPLRSPLVGLPGEFQDTPVVLPVSALCAATVACVRVLFSLVRCTRLGWGLRSPSVPQMIRFLGKTPAAVSFESFPSRGASAARRAGYSLFDGTYYSDNRSNSRANTCNKPRLLEGMHLLDKRSTQALPVALMIHDNSSDRTALVPATHHSNFCPINFRCWTLGWADRSAVGVHRSARPFCQRCAPGLNWPGRASGAVTLKKLECSKQAYALYTLAWDNIIGFRSYCVGLRDRTFAKDVFINQERKLGARRRSDTVLVSTINDADQGSADVAFRTPLAPYEKSKSLGSGGSMVARLKLKGIDGRAPPGVEPAA
ncbi:hypothetical protein S83_059297 [Arachis hypogaea]